MDNGTKLAKIFERIGNEHVKLTKEQEAFAIKEIGRVRAEMALLLADYAGDDGTITRNRIGSLTRELDVIETSLRENGTLALSGAISQSADWTTRRVNGALKDVLGVSVATSSYDTINAEVLRYVTKRFEPDGLILSQRIWDVSDNIRSEIATVIRSGIIRGHGINTMLANVRKVYDNETWKIKRLVQTESTTAYRVAVTLNAKQSEVVDYVKLHAGRKRSPACVSLASADPYGFGAGVYRPGDSQIYNPHVNCTSWISYVLKPEYL